MHHDCMRFVVLSIRVIVDVARVDVMPPYPAICPSIYPLTSLPNHEPLTHKRSGLTSLIIPQHRNERHHHRRLHPHPPTPLPDNLQTRHRIRLPLPTPSLLLPQTPFLILRSQQIQHPTSPNDRFPRLQSLRQIPHHQRPHPHLNRQPEIPEQQKGTHEQELHLSRRVDLR